MTTEQIFALSASADNKVMMVRGPGSGRKICPACRTINVAYNKTCCHCDHKFVPKAKYIPKNPRPKKVVGTTSPHIIKIVEIQGQMAGLLASLAKHQVEIGKLLMQA